METNRRERKLMTVREMGDLLGLKKTERYHLVKKGFFEVLNVSNQMWVVCESFETWYANQVKYQKITGEEPGLALKEWSYSPREISQLLGIDETTVYEIIRTNNIETVTVDYWKRVPKEAFDKWYHSQKRYRTKLDKKKDAAIESETVSMPEMARLLGVDRSTVYRLLQSQTYKDVFEVIIVAERKRITKKSLNHFLSLQYKYKLVNNNKDDGSASGKLLSKPETDSDKPNKTPELLTQSEAAAIAGVSRTTIIRWVEKGYFHEIVAGTTVRIPRTAFTTWLENNRGEIIDGIHKTAKR